MISLLEVMWFGVFVKEQLYWLAFVLLLEEKRLYLSCLDNRVDSSLTCVLYHLSLNALDHSQCIVS